MLHEAELKGNKQTSLDHPQATCGSGEDGDAVPGPVYVTMTKGERNNTGWLHLNKETGGGRTRLDDLIRVSGLRNEDEILQAVLAAPDSLHVGRADKIASEVQFVRRFGGDDGIRAAVHLGRSQLPDGSSYWFLKTAMDSRGGLNKLPDAAWEKTVRTERSLSPSAPGSDAATGVPTEASSVATDAGATRVTATTNSGAEFTLSDAPYPGPAKSRADLEREQAAIGATGHDQKEHLGAQDRNFLRKAVQ